MTIPVLETPLLRMPRLGLGTWPMKGAEAQEAVESALGLGYRHVDTAEMYDNEAAVGAGIAASGVRREEIFLTTKIWHTHLAPADMRAAAKASLERLRTPYVDLLLIHWPAPDMDLDASLETLAALHEAGLARAVGICNFPLGLLRRAVESKRAPIACLQVEYHVYLNQAPLLAYCQQNGLALTAYAPTTKAAVENDPVMRRIAEKHRATPVQIALAWLLGQENVVAIPKAARVANQRTNLAAIELRLDAGDREAIAALPKTRRLVNPSFAPDWTA